MKKEIANLIIEPSAANPILDADRKAVRLLAREALKNLKNGTPVYMEARDVFIMLSIVKGLDDALNEFANSMGVTRED